MLHHDNQTKDLFRAKIREKVEREKLKMDKRIDDTLPSWLRWMVWPLAEWRFDADRARDEARGRGGERNASVYFWLPLPSTWTVINDVVLEPEPEEFVQIDHVLVGPPGVFLVETKAWEGAFLGYKDTWKQKDGNKWVRCESPTKQNLRHKRVREMGRGNRSGLTRPPRRICGPRWSLYPG